MTQVVAFVSRRADGAPYAVRVKLVEDLGISDNSYIKGYKVYVSN